MAAVFPAWTNTATKIVLVAIVVGLAGAIATPIIYARSPYATGEADPVAQPVKFDHRHHVRDDGIDCLFCHEGAETSAYAGIPGADRCMGCHAQIWNDSSLIAPVRISAETGTPIRWRRVHSLPDFVYFDHSVHVTRGIGCVSCHGRVDDMAAVYQVHPLTMSWCLDCHRDPPQPGMRRLTHCSTCHR